MLRPLYKAYLFIGLFIISPYLYAEAALTRQQVDHSFGTRPHDVFLPKTPFNTDEVPSIALSASANAQNVLPVYKVSPNTYFFYGNIAEVDENNRGFNANAGFVVTNEGVVVIDSLGSPLLGQRMISTIKGVTDKPIKYLIITHNHPDHAYGAIAFRKLGGVKIIGHQGTMKYIESGRIEHSVNYRKTFIAKDMQGFEAVVPDSLIGGNLYQKTRITLGEKHFDVYNTGSHHSFGDLVVHQVDENFVWISDLAFNNRTTFMADGNSQAAIETQSWLLNQFKQARLMLPGHGSAQTAEFSMVSKTQNYIQRLRDKMTQALENDIELQEAVDDSEFADWQTIPLYQLNHKKNIDFVYREMEQALF
jgi:glyoxylase-like metal-dependent hydrolase (beta-lactamase superfamily II)